MAKKKSEKDVLIVRDEKTGEISVVAGLDAEVYLVDEPSSALDKETESFVIENLVHFVTERKRQLIMVTHSAEVSAKYPKSLLRIENGDTRGYVYE